MENAENPVQTEVPQTPFEMPKSLEEIDSRVNQYADVLKNIDTDWNLRMQAFKDFQKLLQGGEKMEGFTSLVASKKNIVASLGAQMEDRRSQVVKDACATVTAFANIIKKEFTHYADDLFLELSKLLVVTIKDSAHNCILSFLPYSTNLLPNISTTLSAAHPAQRSRAAEYLQAILEKNEKSEIEPHLEVVEAALKKALTDANAGARASGKKAFLAYKNLWSDRADKFAETLDPSVAKLLVEQKKPSAKAATDLKSLMQRSKQNKPANTEDVVAVVPSMGSNSEISKEGSSIQQVEETKKSAEKVQEKVAPASKPENMSVDIPVANDVETRTRTLEEAPKRPLEEATNSVQERPKRQKSKDESKEDQENDSSKAKTASRTKSSKRGGKQAEYKPGHTPIAMRVRSRSRNTLRA